MASLIYNGIKKNLPRWDVKIVCALHLLRKYQAVYDLVDMTREEVRKKFEQLEYLYLDTRRVGLFKIADNLVDTDSQSLCRLEVFVPVRIFFDKKLSLDLTAGAS